MADSAKEEASEVIFSQFNDVVIEVIEQQSGNVVDVTRCGVRSAGERLERDAEGDLLRSSITIDGEQFHCDFLFAANATTVRALIDFEIDDPKDWLGELANRIAGKVKNNLSEYDVQCQLGLPENPGSLPWMLDELSNEAYVFETHGGPLVAGIQVEASAGLFWQHNPSRITAHDGSILLF